MGRRGPIPKTEEQRSLDGNAGKRSTQPSGKPSRGEVGLCPEWLSEAAKAKWMAVLPELDRLGRLDAVVGDTLAAYCVAWVEIIEATKLLEEEGRVLATNKGYRYPHPAVGQQRTALTAFAKLSAMLGLDPASLARNPARLPTEEDEFERFLDRKRESK